MKNRFSFIAIVSVVFALIGCSDDFGSQSVLKNTGDEIVFGGRAGFEMNEDNGTKAVTRTIYTGKTWIEGEGENQKTYEGVNWIKGDQVRIFCNEAVGAKTADYTVIREEGDTIVEKETGAHQVGLVKNGSVALQWGNTSSPHTFYAVYPSPSQYVGANTAVTEVLNGNTELVGEIPAIQTHLGKYHLTTASTSCTVKTTDASGSVTEATVTGTEYTVAPDMKYAYMVAKTKVENPSKADNEVYLKFMPIATAVEITIRNLAKDKEGTYTFQMANVLVSSANGEPICGQFKTDLDKINLDANGYGTGFPDDTDTEKAISVEGNSGTQISLPMYQDGIYGDPISLGYGDALTFTVFLLPTQDLNSLKVTIQGLGGNKTATIDGVKISKRKKTYLSNIPVAGENVLPFTQEEWLKYVHNDVPIKDLSIPAAGGAASGNKNADGTYVLDDENRQQNLDIEGLWNKGVRCFEFATDIYTIDETTGKNTNTVVTSLGDAHVICNGQNCKITLDEAVSAVATQLNKHEEEFAMVILTYQTLGGWSARTPAKYMTLLNDYWPTVKDKLDANKGCKLGVYNPANLTGGSRGTLFCIARPTSVFQDYGKDVPTPNSEWWGIIAPIVTEDKEEPTLEDPVEGIVVIKGWGALKDKWQQRGYMHGSYRQNTVPEDSTSRPGRPFDVSTMYDGGISHSNNNDFTKYTWHDGTWYGIMPDHTYKPTIALNPDFGYATSLGNRAWVQEWARVSDYTFATIDDIQQMDKQDCSQFLHTGHNEAKAICWNNTYQEKVDHIQTTLNYAVQKTKGDVIYINSLCGYFIDSKYEQSYLPCTLTDFNMSNKQALSKASQTAGLQGNIQRFAYTINKMFYDYLQTYTGGTGYTPGSMGIIMMDRVGEIAIVNGATMDAGNKIPGIIVANNFQHKTAQTRAIPKGGNYQNDDTKLSRKQRGSATNGQMSITWE